MSPRSLVSRMHRSAAVAALLGGLLAGSAAANPPLVNPSFENVGPDGSPTINSPPVPGGAGWSAADGWGVFHNTVPATTVTELVGTTLPAAGFRMIHVETDRIHNGIDQVTGPPGSGVQHGIASGWVLVNSGVVGMGSGNHGNTGIDAQTTTTGVWEFLQAPNGQSPFNTILFYDVSGGADFYVEEASMLELQDRTPWVPLEYSNAFDENAIAGGGGHDGDDPGQVLYTEPIDTPADSNPRDAYDFFPGIEGEFEPDSQIDALANGGDGGFQELLADEAPLLVSLFADPTAAQPVAVFIEDIDGTLGIQYTQRDLDDLDPIKPDELEDVDALEMWGDTGNPDAPGDANFYSTQFDFGASVWYESPGGPVVYLTPGDIVGAVNQLGFDGQPGDADVDALMVQDTGTPGVWDEGDEVIFSIRPFNAWDGGEIVHWRFGAVPEFLAHAGHLWDTAFDVSGAFGVDVDHENVDALETIPVPEPGGVALLCGVSLLGVLDGSRRRRQGMREGMRTSPRA